MRWYGHVYDHDGPMGVVQSQDSRYSLTLPEAILRRAHEEYAKHHNQTFERIQERGGFGLTEVIGLLADALGITEDEHEPLG